MKRLIVRFSDNSGFSVPIPESFETGYSFFEYAKSNIESTLEAKCAYFDTDDIYCTYIGFHSSETKV